MKQLKEPRWVDGWCASLIVLLWAIWGAIAVIVIVLGLFVELVRV